VAAVSSPDRVVYPSTGTTKADVVGHYTAVGERLLKHIAGRPLTLQRFPRGVTEPGFMQKNAPDYFPDYIARCEVPRQDGGTTLHPVAHDLEGIEYLANQNTITFHVPTTTATDTTHPDRLIIDLDPPEDGLGIVRAAAWATRGLLAELEVATVPVVTGSKGYHITAVIARDLAVADVDDFGHLIAAVLADRHPEVITTEFRKANRDGRVFCDWLRNRWGATAAAPWSLRARPRPSVVVPITWDTIDSTAPDYYELGDLPVTDELLTLAATPADLLPALEALRSIAADAGVELEPFDRFRS